MFICSAMIECYVFDSKQWGLPGYRVLFYYQGVKGLEAIGLEPMSVETNCIILLDMSNILYSVNRDSSQRVN